MLLGGGGTASASGLSITPIPIPIIIQPEASGSKPITLTAPTTCAAPSAQTCNDQVWVKYCGAQYGATDPTSTSNPCYAINGAPTSTQTIYGTTQGAQTERTFDPSINDFLAVTPDADGGGVTYRTGTTTSWANQEENAKYNAFHTAISSPLTYQRDYSTATWTDINSCENYVYRSFYDYERWIDAMNACKGDERCVVNVSLNGMTTTGPSTSPGIARRTMNDSEGSAISYRVSQLNSSGQLYDYETNPFTSTDTLTDLPKNAFYAATQYLIVPNLINAFQATGQDAQVQAMLNEIHRGTTYYSMGPGAKTYGGAATAAADGRITRGFRDEWEFHSYMNQHTQALTAGESREYARRAEAESKQLDAVFEETKCLVANVVVPGGCGAQTPAVGGQILPGDSLTWGVDPFESRGTIGALTPMQLAVPTAELQSQVVAQIQAGGIQVGGVQIGGVQVGGIQGTALRTNALASPTPAPAPAAPTTAARSSTLSAMAVVNPGGTIPIDVLNITGPAPFYDPTTDASKAFTFPWLMNLLWQTNPPRIDTSVSYPHLNCDVPTVGRTTSGGLVLTTPLNTDPFHTERAWVDVCKVTNMLLEEWGRAQSAKPSCLDPASVGCDWKPHDFVERFVTANVAHLSAAKEYEYRTCKRWTNGGQITSTDPNIGISARYTLHNVRSVFDARQAKFEQIFKQVPIKAVDDFGTVRADNQRIGNGTFGGGYAYNLGWHAAIKQRDANGKICRLGGSLNAQFNADAVLFGVHSTLVDALAMASSNENDDGTAYVNSHLYVVGYELFDTRDASGASSDGKLSLAGSWSPPADKTTGGDHVQLLEVPFQAGPVTITVTAGIDYSYGAIMAVKATPPAKGSCDVSKPILYDVNASLTPFAELGAWADADASLAGIIGVGIEVDLTLVGISLPLQADASFGLDPSTNSLALQFDSRLDLALTTLKGELDLYIKAFFFKAASFKLIGWPGFTHKFPIFRTPHVSLPLVQLVGQPINPTAYGTPTGG